MNRCKICNKNIGLYNWYYNSVKMCEDCFVETINNTYFNFIIQKREDKNEHNSIS